MIELNISGDSRNRQGQDASENTKDQNGSLNICRITLGCFSLNMIAAFGRSHKRAAAFVRRSLSLLGLI